MPVDKVSSRTAGTAEKTRESSRSRVSKTSSSQKPNEDDLRKRDSKVSSSRHVSSKDNEGAARRESSAVRVRSKVAPETGERMPSRTLVQAEKEGSRRREPSASRSRPKEERVRDVLAKKREQTGAAGSSSTATPLKTLRRSVAASGDQLSPRQTVTSESRRSTVAKDTKTTATRAPRTVKPEDMSRMADRTTTSHRAEKSRTTDRTSHRTDDKSRTSDRTHDKSRTTDRTSHKTNDKSRTTDRTSHRTDASRTTDRTRREVRPEETSRTKHRTSTSDQARQSRSKPAEVPKSKPTDVSKPRRSEFGQDTTEEPKEGRKRTSTRVLSPSEVKMADMAPHVDAVAAAVSGASPTSDALGTEDSTADVFGGVVSDEDEEEYEYEDDFEDYESDFEDDSSDNSAEDDVAAGGGNTASAGELRAQCDERKMDSGNYDMADSRRRSQQVRELQEAMERENKELAAKQRSHSHLEKEAPTSLVDEGFEEERNEDWRGTVPKEVKFINFENARKRQKEQKVAERAKKRGEELLSMIRLDVMKYKLFDLKPVAYDVYMGSYGRANTAQAYVQTNEDNLAEEVQTDEIFTKDMWTQKPPAFQVGASDTLKQDRLGVGGPTCKDDDMDRNSGDVSVDADKLDTFMSKVGPMVLRMLAEDRMSGKLKPPKAKMRFSRGFVPLETDSVPFLAQRPVTLVRFAPGQPSTLLTVHKGGEEDPAKDVRATRCAVCVWDLLNPSSPDKILTARFEVTSACFDTARASLVLAGLEDGALCVWDLREKSVVHQEVTDSEQWLMRSPTYSTAEVLRGDGHLSPVVALQPLIEREAATMTEYSPTQVCSLESAGVVIIWTVIQSFERGLTSGASNQDLGLAPWGRVRLVRSAVISLEDSLPGDQMLRANLECLDLQLLSEDTNHLFISTNTGHVIHCLKIGGKPSPRIYSQQTGAATLATCIEVCPFGLPIFLVGCGDGSVRMHRREKERPLSTMEATADAPGEGPPIVALQWSRSRPTVFFVLDATSRIHVWDLSRSDLSPQYSLELTDSNITAIRLAPDLRNGQKSAQMVIATMQGAVELHDLKEDYSHKSRTEEAKELGRFKQFTDRL